MHTAATKPSHNRPHSRVEKFITMAKLRGLGPNLKKKLTKFIKPARRAPSATEAESETGAPSETAALSEEAGAPPETSPPGEGSHDIPSEPLTTAPPIEGFFDLPGELRNRIYRLVLIQNKSIKISKGNFTEAPLLSVCRQIREEATSIFFFENEWSLDLKDWDHSFRFAFLDHIKARLGIDDDADIDWVWRNSGDMYNKTNLLRFIKMLHENQSVPGFCYMADHYSPATAALTGAFEIAKRMKKCSWKDIERVLDIYLHEVAKKKSGWTWTESPKD